MQVRCKFRTIRPGAAVTLLTHCITLKRRSLMKTLIRIVSGLIVAYFAASAVAQVAPAAVPVPVANPPVAMPASAAKEAGPKLTLMLSPYTYHLNPRPVHKNVYLIGLEREYSNAKLDGLVLFSNSFGQPSVYVYPFGGVCKSVFGVEKLSFKWTAGVIYGYRGEYKDEVANLGGFAPAVIPGLAYEFKPGWSAQVNLLGKAAVQFQLNAPLN
jgi:hypothetical protein